MAGWYPSVATGGRRWRQESKGKTNRVLDCAPGTKEKVLAHRLPPDRDARRFRAPIVVFTSETACAPIGYLPLAE